MRSASKEQWDTKSDELNCAVTAGQKTTLMYDLFTDLKTRNGINILWGMVNVTFKNRHVSSDTDFCCLLSDHLYLCCGGYASLKMTDLTSKQATDFRLITEPGDVPNLMAVDVCKQVPSPDNCITRTVQ